MAGKRKAAHLTWEMVPKDVIRIADETMGKGALESVWRTVDDDSPSHDTTFYLILRVVSGSPVGFALFHYENVRSKSFQYVIGVIDAVCVDKRYMGNGYGSLLTFNALKRMSIHHVDRVEMVMKTLDDPTGVQGLGIDVDELPNSPILGSERFLYDLGFRKVAYLKKHWAEQSLTWRYDCAVCNRSPDVCTGALMTI